MDFYVVLGRPGFSVAERKRKQSRIGYKHLISKDESMKWFQQKVTPGNPYTLTSLCIFFSLFSTHCLWYWKRWICQTINSLSSLWSFSLLPWFCLIQKWYCSEKLDISHSKRRQAPIKTGLKLNWASLLNPLTLRSWAKLATVGKYSYSCDSYYYCFSVADFPNVVYSLLITDWYRFL